MCSEPEAGIPAPSLRGVVIGGGAVAVVALAVCVVMKAWPVLAVLIAACILLATALRAAAGLSVRYWPGLQAAQDERRDERPGSPPVKTAHYEFGERDPWK